MKILIAVLLLVLIGLQFQRGYADSAMVCKITRRAADTGTNFQPVLTRLCADHLQCTVECIRAVIVQLIESTQFVDAQVVIG